MPPPLSHWSPAGLVDQFRNTMLVQLDQLQHELATRYGSSPAPGKSGLAAIPEREKSVSDFKKPTPELCEGRVMPKKCPEGAETTSAADGTIDDEDEGPMMNSERSSEPAERTSERRVSISSQTSYEQKTRMKTLSKRGTTSSIASEGIGRMSGRELQPHLGLEQAMKARLRRMSSVDSRRLSLASSATEGSSSLENFIPNMSDVAAEIAGRTAGDLRVRSTQSSASTSSSARFSSDVKDADGPCLRPGKTWEDLQVSQNTLIRSGRGEILQAIHNILDIPDSSRAAKWYGYLDQFVITCSIGMPIAHSFEPPLIYGFHAAVMEVAVEVIFFVELMTRFVVTPDRLHFIQAAHTWIDVCAAAPLAVRAAIGFEMNLAEDSDRKSVV